MGVLDNNVGKMGGLDNNVEDSRLHSLRDKQTYPANPTQTVGSGEAAFFTDLNGSKWLSGSNSAHFWRNSTECCLASSLCKVYEFDLIKYGNVDSFIIYKGFLF
ncbi:hypothetical protein L1987_23145 [Smallanthus sonchifolius]|uniref:Uncharacterized protein n=1 Tax=Smallanthus sonchifolius TaxID=185202 RepID=A0ACB9IIA3_9ASTR|nr:hypothetical protein L1987_23145 [Smallanthus sonchifolius]